MMFIYRRYNSSVHWSANESRTGYQTRSQSNKEIESYLFNGRKPLGYLLYKFIAHSQYKIDEFDGYVCYCFIIG